MLAGKGFSAGRIILEPGQDPDSLLGWLGGEEFIGYIRKTTRFSRLEIYETDLLKQIKHLLADLSMALTVVERSDIFSQMIPLHKRLGKVTTQLTHSPVLKAMWLINTINENECNS